MATRARLGRRQPITPHIASGQWLLLYGVTRTGTAAVTVKGATCSGSAAFTAPVYTASAAVTAGAATASGLATHVKPTYTGSSSVTIAAATCSATGTFAVSKVWIATLRHAQVLGGGLS